MHKLSTRVDVILRYDSPFASAEGRVAIRDSWRDPNRQDEE
jgi:hypothetical protein